MNKDLLFILLAFFGAICQEVGHWYDLRSKLENPNQLKLFKSRYYWLITIFMMAISGVGSWAIFYEEHFKNATPFALGASFPLILKKLVNVTQKRHLGTPDLKKSVTFEKIWYTYFN